MSTVKMKFRLRKKPRSIKKILNIVYNNITTSLEFDSGLCYTVVLLEREDIITLKEKEIFKLYIFKKYLGPRYEKNTEFFFEPGDRQPRIDLIKQLISKL